MKKTLSLLLALVTFAAAIAAALPSYAAAGFSDVEDGRWSEASISYAVMNGYMNGVGGGKFDPEGSLTRAMVVTVLWRREGSPAPTAPSGFEDVPEGEWYTDAVAWAKETGVVNGLSETEFGPDGLITREQLSTMLFRFSADAPVSVPERADLSPFADDEKVSDWASEPLEWAVEAGLIKGTDGTRLDPDGFATREQFAAIIKRYDGSFRLEYNAPVLRSHFTEPDYPLVTDADFYVSPTGSDSNDGSFDHPFATWNRAVEAVRGIPKTAEKGGIVVAFMAGDYGPLDLSLTAEDSGTPECPVTYCKYGDGDVVFNNGVDFSADSFVPLDKDEKEWFPDKAKDKIKKTDVSSAIPTGTYDLSYSLFSDDNICTVARYPNKYADGTDQLIEAAETLSITTIRLTSQMMINRIKRYHDLSDLKIYGKITFEWFKDTLSVGTYDYDTHEMYISDYYNARSAFSTGGLRWGYNDGELVYKEDIKLCFLNVSEELDVPGEYWVDPKTSTLYVYKPTGSYHMVLKDKMITMNGADNVTFRGLSFYNTKDSVIDAKKCHDITVDLCHVRACGGMYAMIFDGHDPERDFNFTLTRSDFDLGYDAFLRLFGHDTSQKVGYATHMNALIDNNSFTNYGLYLNEESAMYISWCDDVRISHNEFINSGRGAVFYGGSQNVVMEYNYTDRQMVNAEDGGVFCTWNDFYHRGNVVRYNIIKDVSDQGVGGFGLYLDDYSAGTDVYSNLFFDCNGSAVVVHNGRDNLMRDNALVSHSSESSPFFVTLTELYGPESPGTMTDEERNILNDWLNVYSLYEANPALKAYAAAHWPEIFSLSTDPADWDSPDFVLARNNTVTGNRFFNKERDVGIPTSEYVVKYSTIEDNIGYTLDENPIFVNPTLGDYRIKDGADFPDIHFEEIGRY